VCACVSLSSWFAAESEWSILRAPAAKALEKVPPGAVLEVLRLFEEEIAAKKVAPKNPTGLLIRACRSKVWIEPETAAPAAVAAAAAAAHS
jgi:hypothetical protein